MKTLCILEMYDYTGNQASRGKEEQRVCFQKPVGEDEVMKMNAALAENREYTAEYLDALPEDVRAEVIDGQIFYFAAPTTEHQEISSELFFELKAYVKKKRGDCKALYAPVAVRLDCDNKTSLEPDIIVVCDKDKLHKDACYGAPDLVIEVTSRSTRKRDYGLKMKKYRAAGVREYWIVEPERQTVWVSCFEDEEQSCLYSFDDEIAFRIFPDLSACLKNLLQ